MVKCTPQTLVLLIYSQTLRKSEISSQINNRIFDQLRSNENLTSLDFILEKIDEIESTYNCAQRANRSVNKAREDQNTDTSGGYGGNNGIYRRERDCNLCDGRHVSRRLECM